MKVRERQNGMPSSHADDLWIQDLLKLASDGIHVLDRNGNVVLVNDSFCAMLGYEREELLMMNVSQWDAQWSKDELRRKFKDLKGKRNTFETKHRRKDGSVIEVEIGVTGVLMNGNDYLYAAARDITERKRATQALQESEERSRLLLENASDAIFLADVESGLIIDVNIKACELVGCSREELLGKHQSELHPPEIREQSARGFKAASLMPQGQSLRASTHILHRDGTRIPVEISGVVMEVKGRKVRQGIFRDMRDYVRLQAERSQAEKKFKVLVEQSLAGIYIISDGKFTYVNPQFASIYGYTQEEILALPSILQLVSDNDKGLVEENVEKRVQGKVSDLHYTFRGLRKDGSEIDVEVHGTKAHLDGETVVIGTLLDITHQRAALEKLKRSEERYRSLIEQAPEGIFIATLDGTLQIANPKSCTMLGYTKAELEGQSILITYDPAEDDQARERMRRDIPEGKESKFERRMRRKDGTYFLAEISLKRLASGLWQGIFTDVSDRRKSEEQLRMLSQAVEQSQVSIIVTDVLGHIEYVNPKFTKATGYTFEEVRGKNPRFLKSGYTSAEEYKKLWDTIMTGAPWRGEFHNKKKNGELFWEDAVISPIRDERGTITHFLAVKEDITDRKTLEQQVFHTQRMDSLGTLAGGIAHDLNNVLAPILLSVQSLLRKTEDPTGRKLLTNVEQSAQRGKEIVKQVLNFARGGTGEKTLLQLRHSLSDLEHMVHETFPRSIQFKTDFPKDLWTVMADPTQLHQIFMNLCVNARDAMPQGGTLTLSAKNFMVDQSFSQMQLGARPGPYVVVSVADTGTGIPRDRLSRIFDPFYTTKELGKGTGLGLSTVHTQVKNHGGFVRVESTPREGSTFSVFLPAQVSKESVERSRVVEIIPQGNGEVILIVDDERSLLESAKIVLEVNGYQVLTAEDGTEAVTVMAGRKQKIDLAIVDMMMPYMDGTATIRSLKKIDPTVKIIASTGAIADSKHELIEPLLTAFLPKPYTAERLLSVIKKALESAEERSYESPEIA